MAAVHCGPDTAHTCKAHKAKFFAIVVFVPVLRTMCRIPRVEDISITFLYFFMKDFKVFVD